MTIDHIAAFFISQETALYAVCRIVGRISAPLFWFCFAVGYAKTSNKTKYKYRLCISSILMGVGNIIISVMKQDLPVSFLIHTPNMFLSLFLMCCIIDYIEKIKKSLNYQAVIQIIILIILTFTTSLFNEYGFCLVLSVLVFYFIKNRSLQIVIFVIISVFYCLIYQNVIQIFMILASFPIMYYVDKKPSRSIKWLFYIYYPLHQWAFALIA